MYYNIINEKYLNKQVKEENMCLAVPAIVKEIKGDRAIVELEGVTLEISTIFTPEVKVGDYVIVHAGYSITIMEEKEAEETIKLLREVI
jgi:hydrogenase expression/formation protein HypC